MHSRPNIRTIVKDSLITAQSGTKGRFEDTNRNPIYLIVGENKFYWLVFAHYLVTQRYQFFT